MEDYHLEALRKTQRGTIVCGARIGYEGNDCITLEQISDAIDVIGKELHGCGVRPIACIITEGLLVGRTGDGSYRERVYRCEFSTSPRAPALEEDTFKETLFTYATRLGTKMKQERMYVELQGETHVLRRNDKA